MMGMQVWACRLEDSPSRSPLVLLSFLAAGYPLRSLTRNASLYLTTTLLFLTSCDQSTTMAQITRYEDDEKVELSFKPPGAIYGSNHLTIIPADPFFEPTAVVQQQCIEYLASQYPKNEMTSSLYKQVRFVDPGESFETVKCDKCGQVIEME